MINTRIAFLFAAILGATGGRVAVQSPFASIEPTAISGTTHVVKMFGDEKGYRFSPAHLSIKSGDAVKFVVVSGAPHNVVFEDSSISANGDLKTNVGDAFTVSFEGVKPGKYSYYCTPHRAVGMTGVIVVR